MKELSLSFIMNCMPVMLDIIGNECVNEDSRRSLAGRAGSLNVHKSFNIQ